MSATERTDRTAISAILRLNLGITDWLNIVKILIDDLGREGSLSDLDQRLNIVLRKVNLISNFSKVIHSNLACLLKTVGNLHRVNSLVKQLLCLIVMGA